MGWKQKAFNQSVKRNLDRFPEDFMFELNENEFEDLRSQIVTSSWGGRRYSPRVFTEQGVAMLSSILNSRTAIQVNIKIIRIFARLREMVLTHKEILLQLEQIENQVSQNSDDIEMIFSALKQLVSPEYPPRKRIGFNVRDGE